MKMKTLLPIFYLPPVSWFAEFLKDSKNLPAKELLEKHGMYMGFSEEELKAKNINK